MRKIEKLAGLLLPVSVEWENWPHLWRTEPLLERKMQLMTFYYLEKLTQMTLTCRTIDLLIYFDDDLPSISFFMMSNVFRYTVSSFYFSAAVFSSVPCSCMFAVYCSRFAL